VEALFFVLHQKQLQNFCIHISQITQNSMTNRILQDGRPSAHKKKLPIDYFEELMSAE